MANILLLCMLFAISLGQAMPYDVVGDFNQTSFGVNATLTYNPLRLESQEPLGQPERVITNLHVNITYMISNKHIIRVRISDANSPRWEAPIELENLPLTTDSEFDVKITKSPFEIKIVRYFDNATLFHLDPTSEFKFNNHDILIQNTYGQNMNFYGLGERFADFRLNTGTYTLFSKDPDYLVVDDGTAPGGKQTYGVHPFVLATTSSGSASGMFFKNSNAMQATLTDKSVSFEAIGGIIDMYILDGPTPSSVVQQYHTLIGKPPVLPYWAFGWHQSRYGYHTLEESKTTLYRYNKYGLQLDVMWSDIDTYMDGMVFTYCPDRYGDLPDYIDMLHDQGKRWIGIIDPAIPMTNMTSTNATYTPYVDLIDKNTFVMSPNNYPNPFVGKQWYDGGSTWVDWFNPNATSYWVKQLNEYNNKLDFDGIWIDQNEASNKCNGECGYVPVLNTTSFTPGGKNLNENAIDLAASHFNASYPFDPYSVILEYDAHSLFGHMEGMATNQFFTSKSQRPFILSRSTFATSGRYMQAWSGDNNSTWADMRSSIAEIMNFNMFGIPMSGADICGFNGNTTMELCTRWTQLGALYPFARNHNNKPGVSTSQEPWQFGPNHLEMQKLAVQIRYYLLPYLKTVYYGITLKGGMMWQPTFFVYPSDSKLYDTHSMDNFMIGRDLLVHPVLTEGATSVQAYFANDTWYDFYTGALRTPDINGMLTLPCALNDPIPISVKAGSIIPIFEGAPHAMSTTDLLKSPVSLYLVMATHGGAVGFWYNEDGVNTDGTYRNAVFIAYTSGDSIRVYVVSGDHNVDDDHTIPAHSISKFYIVGNLASFSYATYFDEKGDEVTMKAALDYDPEIGMSTIYVNEEINVSEDNTYSFYAYGSNSTSVIFPDIVEVAADIEDMRVFA